VKLDAIDAIRYTGGQVCRTLVSRVLMFLFASSIPKIMVQPAEQTRDKTCRFNKIRHTYLL